MTSPNTIRVTADGSRMGVTVHGLTPQPVAVPVAPSQRTRHRVDVVAYRREPSGDVRVKVFVGQPDPSHTVYEDGWTEIAHIEVPRGAATVPMRAITPVA